jgi:hypothetical protein
MTGFFQDRNMNVFIDVETIPAQPEKEAKARIAETIQAPAQMKKPETIATWHAGEGQYAGVKEAEIEQRYRNTSFDGARGELISIAWAVESGGVYSHCRDLGEHEAEFLAAAFDRISSGLGGRPPFFIGHYIGGFDLKFLFHRAVINRVQPPFELPFYGRHDKDFYDTNIAWAGFRDRISQDNLCAALGIEGKPEDIDGSKVWDFVKAGDVERVAEYNRDDVEKNREIFHRLRFSSFAPS